MVYLLNILCIFSHFGFKMTAGENKTKFKEWNTLDLILESFHYKLITFSTLTSLPYSLFSRCTCNLKLSLSWICLAQISSYIYINKNIYT